jgi:chromate transport protein ChrA
MRAMRVLCDVAQAVWSMARNLCPHRPRAALALLAAALLLVISGSFIQIASLLIGAVGGALLCRNLPAAPDLPAMPVTLRTGGLALALFLTLLVALPLAGAAAPKSLLALAGIFYKAGALVFGGGHVVLPLLRDALVPQGWLSDNAFLAGYGMAQAIPGPLFTFSAYLGAVGGARGHGFAGVGRGARVRFFARHADSAGRLAGMAVAWPSPCRPGGIGRDQRRRGRRSRRGTVQPDLAQCRRRWTGCCNCLSWVSAARTLAGAATRNRGFQRGCGVDIGIGRLTPALKHMAERSTTAPAHRFLLECSGACGDLGTFIPHVIGAMTVAGLAPAGVLFGFAAFLDRHRPVLRPAAARAADEGGLGSDPDGRPPARRGRRRRHDDRRCAAHFGDHRMDRPARARSRNR